MPTPFTLTAADGSEADLLAEVITTPEGGAVRFGLSLSLGAVRAPVSPPPPSFPAPVAYWPFDGDLLDATGNGRALTGPGGGATFGVGKFGQGVANENNSRSGQPWITGTLAGAAWSLAFWYKTIAGSTGIVVEAMVYGEFGNTIIHLKGGVAAVYPNQRAEVVYGGFMTVQGPSSAGDDGWHHVCAVGEVGVVRLYVDGVSAGTVDRTGAFGSFADSGSAGLRADGEPEVGGGAGHAAAPMDELAIWNVALTADQVAALAAGTQTIAQLAGL